MQVVLIISFMCVQDELTFNKSVDDIFVGVSQALSNVDQPLQSSHWRLVGPNMSKF